MVQKGTADTISPPEFAHVLQWIATVALLSRVRAIMHFSIVSAMSMPRLHIYPLIKTNISFLAAMGSISKTRAQHRGRLR
jgi:hypothetical protein